jgi:hypothetical protein
MPARKATVKTVMVGQGCRDIVKRALQEAKVTITREGYTDSSTTTWGFRVRTAKTARKLQDLVWAAGIGWCDVRK